MELRYRVTNRSTTVVSVVGCKILLCDHHGLSRLVWKKSFLTPTNETAQTTDGSSIRFSERIERVTIPLMGSLWTTFVNFRLWNGDNGLFYQLTTSFVIWLVFRTLLRPLNVRNPYSWKFWDNIRILMYSGVYTGPNQCKSPLRTPGFVVEIDW